MKNSFFIIVCLVSTIPLTAQLKLDVDGDARIEGKLNVRSSGFGNMFIGEGAGDVRTSGNENTFIGYMAGNAITTGSNNTFVGKGAGMALTTGFRNTFLGVEAGGATTFSFDNTFVGWGAGFFNTTGSGNTFVGDETGGFNETGQDNTFVGKHAGLQNTSGKENTFIGNNAGRENTTSIRNTFIGYNARQTTASDSLNGSMALGHNARVNCHKCVAIGGTGSETVKVGIGTDTPTRTLDVRGELFIKEMNGIAFFQSSGPNSFIRLENNNGAKGTSVGYFDNNTDKYFFIDTPGPDFGEFVIQDNGFTGIGDLTPDAALDVIGNIHYTGGIFDVSDRRLKENLAFIENPLDKIAKLNGFTYNLIGEVERSAGVSAQDVQKVLPEAVSVIDEGFLGVDYTQLVPLLIEGIKQQQSEINTLKQEMADLKSLLIKAQITQGATED